MCHFRLSISTTLRFSTLFVSRDEVQKHKVAGYFQKHKVIRTEPEILFNVSNVKS